MKFAAVLLVLFILYSATPTLGIKCYLCNEASGTNANERQEELPVVDPEDYKQLVRDSQTAPSCEDWPRKKKKYQCPPSFTACSTGTLKKSGKILSRNCGMEIMAGKCIPMKNIYGKINSCYCASSLCNGEGEVGNAAFSPSPMFLTSSLLFSVITRLLN